MTLSEIQRRLVAFREARQWGRHHTPEALARAVAVEAGELNELFLWGRAPFLADVAAETADVLIYCLNLCNAVGLDAADIIARKIDANEARAVDGDGFVKEGA